MKKKIIIISLIILTSLYLVGCDNNSKDNKIVNNSIVTEAKINSLEPYGYRNSGLKISTTKGNFYMTESDREYFDQIKDLYNFKKVNNKDLIMDIIYDNSSKNNDKLYQIKEAVIIE